MSRLTRKMNYDQARNLNTSCNTIWFVSDFNVQNAHKLIYKIIIIIIVAIWFYVAFRCRGERGAKE